MVIVEKSFPRGAVETNESKQEGDRGHKNLIFGAVQKRIKKPKAKKHDDSLLLGPLGDDKIETISAELLNYESVQDGMNIMGMVKQVDKLYLTISLPGRMTARVSALQISDAYTKISQEFVQQLRPLENYKPLDELYRVGQIVYGHVLEIKERERQHPLITMSLKPSLVHGELQHKNIKKGFVFNGAIEEVQEHGSIVETGIKGLRTFLPMDKAKASHSVGQLVFMRVENVTTDQTVSTCQCKEVEVSNMKIKKQIDPNIDYILPSSIVQFTVQKVLKDGLQGSIMNDTFTAYVNEHQLASSLELPEDYSENSTVNARVLYVMPLTKLVYLSLNLRNENEGETDATFLGNFKRGEIIENAKVHHLGTGGVVLVLNNKYKGIISYKTIKANYKGNYDQDELLTKYAKKTKHKVRVLDYDMMDGMYICTDDARIVNEKVFDFDDVHAGDFIQAVVGEKDPKIGGYKLKVGTLNGIIEKLFLSPTTRVLEDGSKIRCRVMAVDRERRQVYLTNRPEYLSKNAKILSKLENAKPNAVFTGTIVQSNEDYLLIKFFNHLKGVLHRHRLSGIMSQEFDKFSIGQTIQFRIVERRDDKILLGLPEGVFSLGEICPVTVEHKLDSGLEIKVTYKGVEGDENIEMKGLIPLHLLSDFNDLSLAKLRTLPIGMETEAVCILKNIFSLRDVAYFNEHKAKTFADIQAGDVLRAFVKNVDDDVIELMLPIRGYDRLVKVHCKMLLVSAFKNPNITLTPEQVMYVKVLSKEPVTKTIAVTGKLTDIWNGDLGETAQLMERYIDEVMTIRKALRKQNAPISRYSLGEKLSASFKGVHEETNDWIYELGEEKVTAIVKASMVNGKPPRPGHCQQCIVLWVDYSNEIVFVSHRPGDIKHITREPKLTENLSGATAVNAKVILKLQNLFICSLKKGPNPLIYCPARLHVNDFEHMASINVEEGEFCKLAFIHEEKPIAVLHDTWKLWRGIKRKRTKLEKQADSAKKAKKLKMSRRDESHHYDEDVAVDDVDEDEGENEINQKEDVKEVEAASSMEKDKNKSRKTKQNDDLLFWEDKTPNEPPRYVTIAGVDHAEQAPPAKKAKKAVQSLPGVAGFFDLDLKKLHSSQDSTPSSDEEDGSEQHSTLKKKKLTTAEKFRQQREEESRLREIEEKNADPNHLPETVDQFDRLVLSDRNNSKTWINYMVYHLQSAEIDKARAVARRAMKAIDVHNDDERLNIWVALLNLELRYGSQEQFNDTLKEALTFNEPVKVYLRVLDILSDAQKRQELTDMIALITKKFRGQSEVWRAASNALFTIGMTEQAQKLLQKSLISLPEREHVDTIVSFANLNHKHGQNEMAHTLLDQVVTSYPKRVDVWAQYVDMLVKDSMIDSARAVLDRAVMQKLPLKKMRSIFKKYLELEERFGSASDVDKVKKLAMECVKKVKEL